MKPLEKKTLFWDVDPKTIDPQKHAHYIIERILQYGDIEDVKWAVELYGRAVICEVVIKNRVLDPKSQNFWCIYFNVDSASCFQNQSTKKQGAFLQR